MPRKHVNVSFTSYNSLSSYISDQWLKHRKIFKKKKLQVGDLFNWQDDSQQFYIPKNCKLVRNVSSIELERLLHSDSSSIYVKKKNKHSDSIEYVPNMLQYSRVFMQTCQNKGCMCKPIIQGRPKCQIRDEIQVTTEEEKPVIRKNEKIQTEQRKTRVYPDESLDLTKPESQEEIVREEILEPEEILKPKPNEYDRESQTVDEKLKYQEADPNVIRYEMCKKNPCDPCPDDIQYCVPHNVEQLIKESNGKEIQFIQCANKELCTCDKYDTEEGLKKGLYQLPGKNICMQNPPEEIIVEEEPPMEEPEPEPEPEPKEIPEKEIPDKEKKSCKKAEPCCIQSSSSRVCCGFKKKKKRGCCERYIQACRCCSNKGCQPEPIYAFFCTDKETCIDECVSPISCEKVRSIWICSKCGKVYNSSCKRCDTPSCTKNTIILPRTSTPGYCNNQTDILKTLITMEAKQNFRQIDNILLELNQQRMELRKLNDMYHYIAAKSRNSVLPKESLEDSIDNTPKVYICEGCEIDVNRNILRTIMTRADKKRYDNYEKEWEESTEVPDNDKYIKNIINKRKRRPSNGGNARKLRIKTLEDDGSQTSEDSKDYENGNTKLNEKTQTFESTGTDAMAVVGQVQTDNQINTDAQPDKPDHLTKDEMESEKVFVNEFSNTDLEQQPDDRTFLGWCKKSLTSIRQCRSRELMKRLKRKISDCRKSCTESSEAQSEEKVKCDYQYFQNKLNKCKSSLSNMKQQCKEQRICDRQYLQEKMGDCKKSLTNMRDKYNVQKEKGDEHWQNKITLCREINKENKEKKGIMNYCK